MIVKQLFLKGLLAMAMFGAFASCGSSKGYWLLALDSQTHKPYRGEDGEWVLYNCTEATDFDVVMSGGNTSYCDDPEECVADNFAFAMMMDQSLPNQKLLEDIRQLLMHW